MPLRLPIHTGRLVLRRLKRSDLKRFRAYRADAVLARYQGWDPMTSNQAREFIESMRARPTLQPETWIQLAIAGRQDDELLGDIGLCLHGNGDAEIGFTLRREAQGQGFVTEALRGLVRELLRVPEVSRIVGITDERNEASIRVLKRMGMTLASRQETIFKQEPCVELRLELAGGSCGRE